MADVIQSDVKLPQENNNEKQSRDNLSLVSDPSNEEKIEDVSETVQGGDSEKGVVDTLTEGSSAQAPRRRAGCEGDGIEKPMTSTPDSKRPSTLTGLMGESDSSLGDIGKKLSPFEEELGEDEEDMAGVRRKSVALLDAKESAILRLQEELNKSKETLKLRDVEVEKLSKIRDEVGAELEELTASLFEEAHKMVHDANVKRAAAEKRVAEANLKIEMLDAEVQALKALVLTSTPSTPNHHLHPQISPKIDRKNPPSPGKTILNGHKRASSHGGGSGSGFTVSFTGARSSFGAGGGVAAPHSDQSSSHNVPLPHPCPTSSQNSESSAPSLKKEQIDPIAFDEFSDWIENPVLDKDAPFLARIFAEDIGPCFDFKNKQLASEILSAIQSNSIVIEPLLSLNTSLPKSSAAYGGRTCALSQLSRACNYKIRLEEASDDKDPPWHFISDFGRNRVIAVCDFYTYIRYIVQGLVKKKDNTQETFSRVNLLRRNMNLARLGFDTQES